MLTLRPYQQECLLAIQTQHSQGRHRQLISLPTGAGKTVIFANLIKETGLRTLVLAHTNELLEQASDKIKMVCPELDVGIVNGHNKRFDTHAVISSIQAASVASTMSKLAEESFDLVIADECHHFAADGPRKILTHLGFGNGTNKLLVGFSATPFRSDGKGLGEIFDVIAYERGIKEMIADGYLCHPRGLKIATDIDFSRVKTIDGDLQKAALADIMDTPELNRVIAETYQKHASGMATICFGVSVQHAINLSAAFTSLGISSKAIYGEMQHQDRAKIISEYREGAISVLCNCQVLTEGFDAPETSCVIIARPTQSTGLYQQMVGRGLRLYPNKKECLILDCNDNSHNICSSVTLLHDAKCWSIENEQISADIGSKLTEIQAHIPAELNQELKAAIIAFDPMGECFTWIRNGAAYSMRGSGGRHLNVMPNGTHTYEVTFTSEKGSEQIAAGLTFEYAFAAAEDFAKQNIKLFAISDRDASWRDLPITDRQMALIRSYGYRAGIEQLTRGQASQIIGSGALRRTG